jgi:AcrR family transcriptional regulator
MPRVLPGYEEAVKFKITEAALRVFSKQGYHDTRVEEVAAEAGLTKPTLYKYARSKEDLLKSIAESSRRWSEASFLDTGEGLFEILDRNFRELKKSKGSLHLALEITALSSHNEDIKKLNRDTFEAKRRALVAFLLSQQQKGAIRKEIDVDMASRLLTAVFTDIASQLIIGCRESELAPYWRRSVSAILGDYREFERREMPKLAEKGDGR